MDEAARRAHDGDVTTIVETEEATEHFSELLDRALSGEEIIIARAGRPLVKLTPLGQEDRKPFPWGLMKGRVHIDPSFYEPMTEEELALWYGKEGEPFP